MLRNARSQFKQNIRWKNYLKTQNFKASPKTKGKDECFILVLHIEEQLIPSFSN